MDVLTQLVGQTGKIALLLLDRRLLAAAIAVLAAVTVHRLTRDLRISVGRSPAKLLADYYALPAAGQRGPALDREAVILMSLGLPPDGRYLTALRLGGALATFLVLQLIGYPFLLSAAVGAVSYALVGGILDSRWHAFRAGVERDLPLVASRLSGVLQVTASATQALEAVIETLPEDRPVRTFLERVLVEARSRGPAAFAEAREVAQAISPSLATLLLLLSRLAETGGAAYGEAFLSVADELFTIARVRATAAAKAHAARLNLYVILAALVSGSLIFLHTPSLRATLDDPAVQAVQVAAVAALLFGYRLVQDMIRQAMEV